MLKFPENSDQVPVDDVYREILLAYRDRDTSKLDELQTWIENNKKRLESVGAHLYTINIIAQQQVVRVAKSVLAET
jgi:hypothetical protein